MNRLPQLNDYGGKQRKQLISFGGYNHNDSIGEGEFYDMQNLCSDDYPVLTARKPRKVIQAMIKPNGLTAKNALAWVDGTNFYYDGVIRGAVTDSEKKFVSMGAYLLIFPDKMIYNTATGEFKSLESTYISAVPGTIYGSMMDGTITDPASAVYVKITASGIHTNFNLHDGVAISGCALSDLNKTATIAAIGTDFIVIIGTLSAVTSQPVGITLKRTVPDMDFITESQNRLWGCSSAKHEIYASKLGDPYNWNCYEGISTDSYTASVGSDGDFTGAYTYSGYVLFFKEDGIHRVHGSNPSNYEVYYTPCRGVAKGCEKSIVLVNETLYYMSKNGVVAYGGGSPDSISHALGDIKYTEAVCGGIGNKYYASLKDESGRWTMFVFDSLSGAWHKEDNLHSSWFVNHTGILYYIDASTNELKSITGGENETISWYAEFGSFTEKTMNKKYLTKVLIKLDLESETFFEASIMYDNTGVWERVADVTSVQRRAYTLPVKIRRCDDYKLKFSGTGAFKLYAVEKVYKEGSEF